MTDEIAAENPFRQAVWRTYTPADGLSGLDLHMIAQDRDGYLWTTAFHTGVSRFDGEEFRTFTRDDGLAGNIILAILCDSQGRLWFGTLDGGACWHDGRSFHQVEMPGELGSISYIFEDRDGRIWLAGGGTLCYLEGEQVRDLRSELRRDCGFYSSQCWGITQDNEGRIWLGMRYPVCYDDRREAGGRFRALGEEDGFSAQVPSYAVGAGKSGDVWIGGRDRILRYDGDVFHTVLRQEELIVRAISRDRDGRVWFSTDGRGAYCHDGDRLHHLTEADGLGRGSRYHYLTSEDSSLRESIVDVFHDREGLLWFSIWGGGVSCCDPHAIHRTGAEFDLRDLCADASSAIWLGAQSGLVGLERTDLGVAPAEGAAEFDDIYALCPDADGGLWLGGRRGLARWDGRRLRVLGPEEGFDGAYVTALFHDPEQGLFLAHHDPKRTELRVSRYDGSAFHSLHRRRSWFWFDRITCLLVTRDRRLWFGLSGDEGQALGEAGIARLEADGSVTTYFVGLKCPGSEHPRGEDELVDRRVEGMVEDRQGRLWVATRGGVSCFEGERFRNFTPRNGLPVSGILCVCEDGDGGLWFGSDSGIIRYDGRQQDAPRFQLIRSPYLLAVRRIIQDEDGSFWCATPAGVVRYRPTRVPPRAHLQRVVADQVHEGDDTAEVTSSGNQVSFEYRGLSLRTPIRDLLYSYRLKGVDDGWQDSRQRRVTYADLTPGEYTFEVKAIDRDLNESEPAVCRLEIVPDQRVAALSRELGGTIGEFVGSSAALRKVQGQLGQVAGTDLTVLILGETGTGKGLAARTLHGLSDRRDGPFIPVNCGAIPADLVESELFGHEKGAFTGAVQRRLGKVELAQGGTLFLDEIGDMPVEAQVKLLRLLEERTFERVGDSRIRTADARVVAATNLRSERAVGRRQI